MDKVTAVLTALLETANGKRKKFLLVMKDVEATIADALADATGIAVRHGGKLPLAKTTVCLAVKDGTDVVVGITSCSADRPSPGVAWKDLQPWQQQDFAKNAEKAKKWARAKKPDRVRVHAKGATKSKAKPGNLDALLDAILEDPTDDASRLVYADVIAASDPARSEFITVQVQLAKAKPGSAEKRALTRRETALLKHEHVWTKDVMQVADAATMKRGFVESIEIKGKTWAKHGAKLLSTHPIEIVYVEQGNAAHLNAVAGAPCTAKLRQLDVVYSGPVQDSALGAFLRSAHVGALRELVISTVGDLPPDLFEGVTLPNLEVLDLTLFAVAPAVYASLATLKAPKLRELNTHGKAKGVAALRAAFPKASVK
ncbi:MAG: TIGR02996 domain-containing protein [Proteobacteria bacterium]|nr:TIGR02996 domain-containing protein [Pseudomonadota bacterium]